jgi:hypothetical protein
LQQDLFVADLSGACVLRRHGGGHVTSIIATLAVTHFTREVIESNDAAIADRKGSADHVA